MLHTILLPTIGLLPLFPQLKCYVIHGLWSGKSPDLFILPNQTGHRMFYGFDQTENWTSSHVTASWLHAGWILPLCWGLGRSERRREEKKGKKRKRTKLCRGGRNTWSFLQALLKYHKECNLILVNTCQNMKLWQKSNRDNMVQHYSSSLYPFFFTSHFQQYIKAPSNDTIIQISGRIMDEKIYHIEHN